MAKPKSYHESFASFFENPTRDGLRELLKANHGELRACDFKAEWPDGPRLSKHVLGMANSSGGCIVVGVAEAEDGSLDSTGIAKLKDKADITNGLKNYVPEYLLGLTDVVDFTFDASEYDKLVGKRFQVLFVEDDPTHVPFVSVKGSGTSLRQSAVYVRRDGLTEEAGNDALQTIINRRLATGHSTQRELDLKTHLDQLKILYSFVVRQNSSLGSLIGNMAFGGLMTANPRFPKEDFEAFVVRMIKEKKRRIAEELDVVRASG